MKLVSQYQMVGRLPSNPTDNSLPTVNIYILYIQISLSEVKLHAEFINVGISVFKKRSFCCFQNGFDFDTNHQNIII